MTATKLAIGKTADFSAELGMCIKAEGKQIAVFFVPDTEQQWFAIDNYNPQNQRMVLSRGLVGDEEGIPFVACPLHKYRYSLKDGNCLTDEQYSIQTYAVSIENDEVFIQV